MHGLLTSVTDQGFYKLEIQIEEQNKVQQRCELRRPLCLPKEAGIKICLSGGDQALGSMETRGSQLWEPGKGPCISFLLLHDKLPQM